MPKTLLVDITPRIMGLKRNDYEAAYLTERIDPSKGMHIHVYYEFYISIAGGRQFCVNGNLHSIGRGDLLIFPPNQMHGLVSCAPNEKYERIYVYASPEILRHAGCDILPLAHAFTEASHDGRFKYSLPEERLQQCIELAKQIHANEDDQSPLTQIRDISLLMQFFAIIYEIVSSASNATCYTLENATIQSVLSYIHQHFTEPITLDTLATQFCISKSYLSHEFAKCTANSVYDYILTRRIVYCRELIANNVPLNEVALQAGFTEYSNFLRAFKRISGMNPSDYRKLIRGLYDG